MIDRDELETVLERHQLDIWSCTCGRWGATNKENPRAAHRKHVADELLAAISSTPRQITPLYIVKVKHPETGRWHTLKGGSGRRRDGKGLYRLFESRRDAEADANCLIGIETRVEPYFAFFPRTS